ncbi:histidine ammonia-lyase [Paenibacillus sacheonensis]|uniref:Histidine ammonia-lyase n=1 Tax=Paenibacillus sacheonensis TaxID=742054 RepID=A0A7X5BXI9_9BACL|nr:histidine ammonia-lyase [Paenibacillus sacheonensis]MBM7566376.1 histidine ammonia-lyase [Paenibacillus sacheonensis]NBC70578.1 histidine ammonia-lyase [Paenibacillus sacheonensis]
MTPVILDGRNLTPEAVMEVAVELREVVLSGEAGERVGRCREMAEELASAGKVVYGVNTGFGKFSDVLISPQDTARLQINLIRSHACAVGRPLPEETVRALMLLRANALAKGYSGIRLAVLQLLIDCVNRGVHPVVPEQGSLGASGDLAPLSHLALVLMGEGEAYYLGERLPGGEALVRAGLRPIALQAKEGLALINGTQAMTAIGTLTFMRSRRLARIADAIAALTLECLRGIPEAFAEEVHRARPYPEQIGVAKNLRALLKGSRLTTRQGEIRVQDAYSLRCLPQVHGATRQTLEYVRDKLTIEINSATDNPLLFLEEGMVVSSGNFHGQPIAFAMDFLKIGMSELANISERRTERLVNPALSGGLPSFLSHAPGIASGLMITQYVSASLVSENKVLAHPSSVDSIPSSANQEDHVSMGTTAARHAVQVVDNAAKVLAIELICAAEASEFVGADGLAPATRALYDQLRARVRPVVDDRSLSQDIERTAAALLSGEWLVAVEAAAGPLY